MKREKKTYFLMLCSARYAFIPFLVLFPDALFFVTLQFFFFRYLLHSLDERDRLYSCSILTPLSFSLSLSLSLSLLSFSFEASAIALDALSSITFTLC